MCPGAARVVEPAQPSAGAGGKVGRWWRGGWQECGEHCPGVGPGGHGEIGKPGKGQRTKQVMTRLLGKSRQGASQGRTKSEVRQDTKLDHKEVV